MDDFGTECSTNASEINMSADQISPCLSFLRRNQTRPNPKPKLLQRSRQAKNQKLQTGAEEKKSRNSIAKIRLPKTTRLREAQKAALTSGGIKLVDQLRQKRREERRAKKLRTLEDFLDDLKLSKIDRLSPSGNSFLTFIHHPALFMWLWARYYDIWGRSEW